VEDDGVVFGRGGFVHKVAAIAKTNVELFRIEVKVVGGDRHDGGVDFDDVDARAFLGKLSGDDAHSEADAEDVGDGGSIGAGEVVQHVSEHAEAFLVGDLVGVLQQVIVKIKAALALALLQNLEHAE